jgi:S-adenosylhomocysteine hydrolase
VTGLILESWVKVFSLARHKPKDVMDCSKALPAVGKAHKVAQEVRQIEQKVASLRRLSRHVHTAELDSLGAQLRYKLHQLVVKILGKVVLPRKTAHSTGIKND